MTANTSEMLRDPDLFSAEVHHCLLTQGLRSRRLRGLMRAARRNAELERIFETKVTEFRRYLREIRLPTFWNMPIRAGEWLADNARFTPPRAVMTTLAYVAFVLVGVEMVKSWRPWDHATRTLADSRGFAAHWGTFEPDPDSYSTRKESTSSLSSVDHWLTKEFQQAAQSSEVQQVLQDRIRSAVDSASADIKRQQAAHKQSMQDWIEADEFRQLVIASIQRSVPSAVVPDNVTVNSPSAAGPALDAAVKKSMQELLESEEFKRAVSDAIRSAGATPSKPEQTAAVPVAKAGGAP